MQSLTRTLFFLLLSAFLAQSVVHKLSARHQMASSPKMERLRRMQWNRVLREEFGEHAVQIKKAISQKASSTQITFSDLALVGNITIGTPAQQFTVEFDTFFAEDLNVLGEKANLKWLFWLADNKTVYAEGNSTTHVNTTGNFSHAGWKGHLGNDLVDVQGQSAQLTFGVIDKVNVLSKYYSADGLLGLGISKSKNNITNAVTQLLADAEKPVITQAWNISGPLNTTAHISLGEEDSEHCEDNWSYVPGGGQLYAVHLASANADVNGTQQSVALNATAGLLPMFNGIIVGKDLYSLIVNASNASYNWTTFEYVVDCDVSKAGSVILNIGGQGNSTNGTQQLVLTGADYVAYDEIFDQCYLNVVLNLWSDKYLTLGTNFLNSHCIAYNTKEQLVGFADSKQRKTNLRN